MFFSKEEKEKYGQEIEKLELLVEIEDHEKFLSIIEEHLKDTCPTLSILSSVAILKTNQIKNLWNELLTLNYYEEES